MAIYRSPPSVNWSRTVNMSASFGLTAGWPNKYLTIQLFDQPYIWSTKYLINQIDWPIANNAFVTTFHMNIYCQIKYKIYVSKYCLTKQILTSGLLCHHWYRLLDNFLPGRTLKTIVFKIAWDQVTLECIRTTSLVRHMLFHLQPDRQGTWVCSDKSI